MSKPKLVVVGNGMAGVRCVEEIYRLAPELYDITIIGSEPRPNYNRIMLSKVLQGDASLRDIVSHDWHWYEERGIRLFAGSPVVRIDSATRVVETASGRTAEYDKLVLATGSSAFIPPLPGVGKPGVIGFRSVDDCERMMEAAKSYRRAAVIGGGLLGLEAARGLLHLGMEVTVVHNASYLMNRQLDRMSADMLREELERQGMRFLFGKRSERIVGRKRAEGVAFADGTKLQADLIVMAVGIRPNVELAKSSGVLTNRAFVVNDNLETNMPDIYAVGECAEHDGMVYGLVAPLFEQGKVLAKRLCGLESAPYRGSIPYAQLKVSGVDVFSAGDVNDPEAQTAVQLYDGIRGTYQKVLSRQGKVAGAILFGDIGESNALLRLLRNGADVAALARKTGRQADGGGADEAASIPDAETVCQCNGVSKGAIVQAVQKGGLMTVEQVRDKTRASGSCGGCKPLVSAILKLALSGGGAERVEEPAVCACTKLGHAALKEAVRSGSYGGAQGAAATGASGSPQETSAVEDSDNPREAIADGKSGNVRKVMAALDWRDPEGCPTCRAAIRYYLGSGGREGVAPISDADSVVSVAPVSAASASALDALGVFPPAHEMDVAPLFAEESGFVPRVHVSSGSAGVARVGAELARRLFRLRMPTNVCVGVASASAERSGLLVRDFGLAEAPAGWELYAGGFADRPVKQAQLLVIASGEEEALAMAVACINMYAETAFYGEAPWKWLERIGLFTVRERLLDPDSRERRLERGHVWGQEIQLTPAKSGQAV